MFCCGNTGTLSYVQSIVTVHGIGRKYRLKPEWARPTPWREAWKELTDMYTHTVHTHMYTHSHMCTHMYTHSHMCTHTHVHTFTHVHTHMYTHTHKCAHTHVHTFTHVHTHMYTHSHMCLKLLLARFPRHRIHYNNTHNISSKFVFGQF